ncbi:MAG: lipocalin family protein [Chitinophagaceae bacterium]|nr:lipocalin family protein [Oligoflexus sp.]
MFKPLAVMAGLLISTSSFAGIFPEVVSSLDLNSFLGRWYEVASTHPSFQKNCVCVTADYKLLDVAKVSVVNTCRKVAPDGVIDVAVGTATTTSNPAKLNVSFGKFKLPFSNYWVVDRADDYRYAVVSTPLRTPVWVLSRTPDIAPADLEGIYQRLEESGFNTKRIKPTSQTACSYTEE